jgi:hypothetical protein
MESDRFDRLVKSLVSSDTRRGLLRLLLSRAGGGSRDPARGGERAGGNGAMVGRGGHGGIRSGMTPAERRTSGSANGNVRTDEMTRVAWATSQRARPACRSISSAIPTHRSAAAGRP